MLHLLKARLLGFWLLSLFACIAAGLLVMQLHQQSTAAQIRRAEAVVARACDLIRDRYGFYDTRRREAIGDMLGQIDRLDGLVGELPAMTQRVDSRPVCVDLSAFLSEQVDRHKEIAAAKSLAVSVRNAVSLAMIDPVVICRVLDNLMTNAIWHAPEGGSVTHPADRQPALLVLTVEDSGPGVPSELTDRLFEPFVTGRPEGTGLGLAIARELTDAHGGRLALRSARHGPPPLGGPDASPPC